MTDFYGEEMINEVILFYQNLRSNDVIGDFSNEEVDMEEIIVLVIFSFCCEALPCG
jgi:hypothetical protein